MGHAGGFGTPGRPANWQMRPGRSPAAEFRCAFRARQAVFEALAVAMRFEVAERQLDLHAAGIQRHQLTCAELERGRSHQQPGFAFARRRLAAGRCATGVADEGCGVCGPSALR